MLSRARQYRKEGIKYQNSKAYEAAILAYKQARGEASEAIEPSSSFNRHQNHLCYAIKAEVSINIAECLISQAMDDFENDRKKLADLMPVFTDVAEALQEAQENIMHQSEAIAQAFGADHESIRKSNAELKASLIKVKQFITKNKIVLYFNTAVDIIHEIDRKHEALLSKMEVPAKTSKTKSENRQLSEALKSQLEEALKLLRSALSAANSITDESEAKDIKDVMIELYEQKGDIFSLLEGDENFYEVKKSYLDFILVQYSDAFHIAHEARKPKAELLPLFMSVLNVLEEKAKLASYYDGASDIAIRKKIMEACIEIIKFHKKFTLADGMLDAEEKMEIQSYLFTAHRLLASNYELPSDALTGQVDQDNRERMKRRQAHQAFAMDHARNFCELAQGVKFDKTDPLYQDLLEIRFYYCSQIFNEAMVALAAHPTFSQDTASLIMFFLSLIHREGRKEAVFSIFDFDKGDASLRGGSFKYALEFIQQAILTSLDEKLRNHIIENMKFIFEKDERNFLLPAVENKFVPYHVDDENQQLFFRTYMKKKPEELAKLPIEQRPAYIMFNKVLSSLNIRDLKLSKADARDKLESFVDEYFILMDTVFTKAQIAHATPLLLRECARFLKEHLYPEEALVPLLKHADALEKLMQGEVKLWQEKKVVYKNGVPENLFWQDKDVKHVQKHGRMVRSKPVSPPPSPRLEERKEKKKRVRLKLSGEVPELETKTHGLRHVGLQTPAPVVFQGPPRGRSEKRPAEGYNEQQKRSRKRSPSPT